MSSWLSVALLPDHESDHEGDRLDEGEELDEEEEDNMGFIAPPPVRIPVFLPPVADGLAVVPVPVPDCFFE